MEYLFTRIKNIEERLRDKFILLLLDYDGTLAPIAETPKGAFMRKDTKELLEKLSRNPYCKLGIISGRSLKDLKGMVGIEGVIYAGNHGLEIESPKIKFESQASPRLKSIIQNISGRLQKRLSGIKGALIEDKGLTLSIHFRLVEEKDMPAFKKVICEVTDPYVAQDNIKIDSGKKVYEIKPPIKWDKGKVALWLLARQQFASGEKKVFPVYIGDDVTDEDAFRALKRKGLTISVGKSEASSADFYLKSTDDVAKFLLFISGLKGN